LDRTRRRSSREARREALEVARELLLALGPSGITLNRVAAKVERSHATLIHHFGSAEGLQSSLMSSMVDDLSRVLAGAMQELGPGPERARRLVDVVFDAFDRDGAAALAAWIMLAHKERYLEPIRSAVEALGANIDARLSNDLGDRTRHIPSALLFLTLCAFADALIGRDLTAMLRLDKHAMRQLAADLLPGFF